MLLENLWLRFSFKENLKNLVKSNESSLVKIFIEGKP